MIRGLAQFGNLATRGAPTRCSISPSAILLYGSFAFPRGNVAYVAFHRMPHWHWAYCGKTINIDLCNLMH